ncbi:hypothetical protein E2I00_000109 [Balaenoptera physalus]|uniref:Uncharacterized protein n=1 Tax=Balaenoptera physalus TaxID=9770 RepID=A0A643BNE7_BALPH|nr:hypothetical protein E2I00_000109 [Balaenoptera physalus]
MCSVAPTLAVTLTPDAAAKASVEVTGPPIPGPPGASGPSRSTGKRYCFRSMLAPSTNTLVAHILPCEDMSQTLKTMVRRTVSQGRRTEPVTHCSSRKTFHI